VRLTITVQSSAQRLFDHPVYLLSFRRDATPSSSGSGSPNGTECEGITFLQYAGGYLPVDMM